VARCVRYTYAALVDEHDDATPGSGSGGHLGCDTRVVACSVRGEDHERGGDAGARGGGVDTVGAPRGLVPEGGQGRGDGMSDGGAASRRMILRQLTGDGGGHIGRHQCTHVAIADTTNDWLRGTKLPGIVQ
jgi:hypothetical protein